jgi:beta-phosphoglucomutase
MLCASDSTTFLDGRSEYCWPAICCCERMVIHGFIFDLDGVLTDTAEYHYRAWKRLADEERIPFDRKQNEALLGVSRRRSLELLLNGRVFPEDNMREMMERKNNYYVESLKQITPAGVLPGVRSLLAEIRAAGMKIAIGSASKNARQVVERLAIGELIDELADGNSVARTKPEPDLFVYAAGLLGVPVGECVVIEDAEAGIEAGNIAGMYTVGLGPVERVGKATTVFPSLEDVTLDALMHCLILATSGA